MAGKDLLTRLGDAGEEALARLAESPGADRVVGYANVMRDRVDELQKKVRGIDELERRVADLERKLEEATASGARGRTPARPAGSTSARAKKAAAQSSAGGAAKPRRAAGSGKGTSGATKPRSTGGGTRGSARRSGGSSGKTGGASPG